MDNQEMILEARIVNQLLDFEIDETDLEDDIIEDFLTNTKEEALIKMVAAQRGETVEKIMNYKYSLFDTLDKLNTSKADLLVFRAEVAAGTLDGSDYCNCVIGKIYKIQTAKSLGGFGGFNQPLRQFEPIEKFIIRNPKGMTLETQSVLMWTDEYIESLN